MSDEKDVEIDPRFDRAFQRGFDPGTPVEEYVPPALPRRETAPPQGPTAPMAATTVAVPLPLVEVQAIAAADEAASPSEPVADATPDASPSRNPFLLFLGIISIALVAAGIWLFVRSGDAFNSREVRSQGDYMSLDSTIHMAPFIALLGGATAIGILFFFAQNWRKRR